MGPDAETESQNGPGLVVTQFTSFSFLLFLHHLNIPFYKSSSWPLHTPSPVPSSIFTMTALGSPITSAIPSSNPITSVSANFSPPPIYANNQQLLARLNLDLRGRVFPVDRETLMLLPESVLLGLFPQGLILSKPASWDGADDGVFTVDVSWSWPAFLSLLSFFNGSEGGS